MALEGNLKDFSLADMFRLLASGSKTGTLHVEGAEGEGVVCFRDGQVFFASSSGTVEAAGKRLVRAGIISEKQLRQAQGLMKIQKKDKAGRKLGQILVDEGYVESDVLEDFIREQIADALFDLLRWEEGDLRFEPDESCDEDDIGISVLASRTCSWPTPAAASRCGTRSGRRSRRMDTRFAMARAPRRQVDGDPPQAARVDAAVLPARRPQRARARRADRLQRLRDRARSSTACTPAG